eukprot:m51a1_g7687 hypothetical protein (173) ;mRNA; f:36344-37137
MLEWFSLYHVVSGLAVLEGALLMLVLLPLPLFLRMAGLKTASSLFRLPACKYMVISAVILVGFYTMDQFNRASSLDFRLHHHEGHTHAEGEGHVEGDHSHHSQAQLMSLYKQLYECQRNWFVGGAALYLMVAIWMAVPLIERAFGASGTQPGDEDASDDTACAKTPADKKRD